MTSADRLPDDPADAEDHQRRLRRGLISLVVLAAVVAGLLLAVPGLHGVARRVSEMSGGLVVVALVLEILSCFGYVLAFMLVFDRAPLGFAVRVAWTEMAFGAAVALGGAGSLAIGAWVLTQRGAPPGRIAERSAVLFLLTSAINVIVLAVFGLATGIGILRGPSDPLLTYLPGGVGVAVIAGFLAIPPLMDRRVPPRAPGRVTRVLQGTSQSIRDTARILVTPDWRLLGAVGYLLFDIGVMWTCLRATGHAPPVAAVVLAYQIGYLSNVIPVPGGIGILDGSLIGTLTLYGTNATAAAAATVVYHAIALWIPALGTIAFIRLQRSSDQPLTLRPPRAQRRRERIARRRVRRRTGEPPEDDPR